MAKNQGHHNGTHTQHRKGEGGDNDQFKRANSTQGIFPCWICVPSWQTSCASCAINSMASVAHLRTEVKNRGYPSLPPNSLHSESGFFTFARGKFLHGYFPIPGQIILRQDQLDIQAAV